MNFMMFHSVGNFIVPTDELIVFRGVGIPPTRIKFAHSYVRYSILLFIG